MINLKNKMLVNIVRFIIRINQVIAIMLMFTTAMEVNGLVIYMNISRTRDTLCFVSYQMIMWEKHAK